MEDRMYDQGRCNECKPAELGKAIKKGKQVDIEFSNLDNTVDRLEKAVCELSDLLFNTVCKEIVKAQNDQKEPELPLVPLAKKIKSFKKRIVNITDRVSNLIDGCEI